MTATSAAEPAVDQQPSVSNAVRKNVTALFGDLVGSTAFGERVDPEAARSALAPYFEILRSTIEDHAGTVVKFTGDGVMAIFGIPEVAEDDALRAVAAGLELQRQFRGFADSVREQHGVELGMRVGINTGELVTGDGDADLVGDVLNTAARLEAACQPGRVMVGEDTWRLTRSAVSYEVLGEVRVKGKTDAIATFQVVDDDRGVAEDTTPFVGRRDELDALRSAFDDTRSSATAKLVTVIGAPGVGKTRLAAELRSGVDARSFDLRFERRGSTTFTPIVELLRELTGSGSAEDVAHLVTDHAEATRLANVLASFLGHGEARSTEESFWAVRRLLEHLATQGPLVVVVDDIQWAEPLFWDLLDHLVEWTTAPVLLVALARPELRELRPELTQTGRRVAASVSLEGLDADTTRELAARLLDTDELPADLIERIPESTEGNPLFIRELIQMLVDDGVLARDGERWRLTIDADAIEVPPTVLSLLASRVERLPDDERQVIELASVIGTEFDRGVLGSIASTDVGGRLGALIDRLRRKDLIEPSGSWAGDHPVYRFHHVLVRDAAYRRLLKGHRADLHERVGRYLDDQGIDGDENDVVVAFHYEQVHRYRTELGTLDAATRALAAQAGERLRHAADQALAREDLSSAGGYAERALVLTDDPERRSELLLIGCEALLSSGDVGRGAGLVDELSAVDADERLMAWADCFRSQLWSFTDSERLSEAAELADDAAGRLAALDDQAGVAKARLVRASTLARLGRIGECEAELDLALGAARTAGDRRRTVAVLGAAPLAALWGPSPVARAGGRCLDVLRLLRITTSSPAVEATSVRCQGLLEALRGRFDSAHEKFEASRTTARDLGLRQGLYETELFEGFVELLADDPVAAEPHLRLARDGLGALGIGADAGQAAALLARSLLRQGRIDEADELATAALATAGENLQTAVGSRAVLGEIRAVQGRAEEAQLLVAEAIEIAERTDIILDHAIALRSAARIAGLRGDEPQSERYRAASELLLADKGVTGLGAVRAPTVDDGPGGAVERPNQATGTNAAAAAMESIVLARSRADFADGRGQFHPDFVARLGGRVFGALDDMNLDEFDDLAGGVFELGGVFETEVVALRGDDLVMGWLRIVVDDDVSDRLVITRLDDGLVRELVFFDADQLRAAYDELDRQWVEFDGVNSDWLATSRAFLEVMESGDAVAIRSRLDGDFVSVDHRPLGLGTRTADEFVETFRSGDTGARVIRSFQLVEPIEIGETGALVRVRFTYADDSTGDMLSVTLRRDGRVVRQEVFPPDRLADARRCYDDLTSRGSTARGRTVSNDASQAFEAWAAGRGYIVSEVLAVRARNVALGRSAMTAGADVVELIHLVEVDTDGQIVRSETFDHPYVLRDALDRLDEIHVEHGGSAGFADITRRMRRASTDGDWDAVRDCLAPGWTFHDRRPLGLGMLDREEYIRSSVRAGTAYLIMEIIEDTGSVALSHDQFVAPDGSRWEHLAVMTYGAGLSQSLELFAVDDGEAAESRFAELAADSTERAPVLTNRAWEITQQVYADDMNPEIYAGLHHEDFVSVDHERFTLEPGKRIGRDEYVASVFETWEFGAEINAHAELVAVRGDDLCLVLNTFEIDDSLIERLVVVRTDGARIVRTDWYDYTDLAGALDELDDQWAATGGPAGLLDIAKRVRRAWVARDLVAYRACLSDDYVSIDHRPLGMGHFDADEHAKSIGPMLGLERAVFPVVAEIAEWNESTTVQRLRITAADDSTWDFWNLTTYADGRLTRMESFALDQFDAAQRRFRELADFADLPPFANEASRIVEEFVRVVNDTGVDSARHLVGSDFVSRLSQVSLMGVLGDVDADGHLALIGDAVSEGASTTIDRLIAIRGDHLCLHQLSLRRDDDVSERLCVSRVEGGLAKEVVWFDGDDLTEALHELDRQWAVTGGPAAYLAVRRRFADAARAGDATAARTVLADDFTSVDHRRLGLGTRNADEWLESVSVIYGFESATTTIAAQPIAWTDEALLYRHTIDTGEDLGDVSWNVLSVVATDGDSITSWDNFDLDQLDAARARFDELVAVAPSPSTSREPSNEATRLSDALMATGRRRDRDGFAALLDESFESVDLTRFTMSPGAIETRSEFLSSTFDGDHWQAMIDGSVESVVSTQIRVIAVRGETVALFAHVTALGDSVVENLVLVETRDQLIVRISWFDGDDIHNALDLLDERYIELGGPSDVVTLIQRARHAGRDGDRHRALALLAPGFHYDDRRPLGIGTIDRDEFVLTSIVPGGHLHVDVEYIREENGVLLVHQRFETPDGSVWRYYAVNAMTASSFVSISAFDLDDLEAAVAEYERLTTTHRVAMSADSPISNAASRVVERSFEALLERGLDAHLGFIDPDFHFVVRRSTALGQEGGAEEWSDAVTWWLGQDIAGIEVRTHATRTESLTVGDLQVTTTAGDEWGFRYVVEICDGKLVRLTSHDTDANGLLESLDEQDRRWVAQGGPETVADLSSRFRRAINSGVRDEIEACVSDDFQSIDHRSLGLGHRIADEFIESNFHVAGEDFYAFPTVITEHDTDGGHWLARWIRGSSSSDASWEFWTISVSRDGRLTRVETFDLGDHDAARARYDELTVDDPVSG